MPKPVSLLTVQEAHKEYSSLIDQIRAKYEQLDSGEFGLPGRQAVLVKVWRMQLCSHRYVRITGLLSAPLVNVRIGDWLCILPAITLVVDKSKKFNKAASSDQW